MRNTILLAILLTLIIAGIAHRLTLPQPKNNPKTVLPSPTLYREITKQATASPSLIQSSRQSSPSSLKTP